MSFLIRKPMPSPKGKERISPFREIEKKDNYTLVLTFCCSRKGRLSMGLLVVACYSHRYCRVITQKYDTFLSSPLLLFVFS